MNIAGIEINKEKVFTFFADPKTQATIRAWVVAPSGWLAIHAAKWFGLDVNDLGVVATWVIYLAPYAVVYGWSIAQKTQKAIISQAAAMLAKGATGTIIVNQNASAGALQIAADPAVPNVVHAGSADAQKAANA